MLSLTYVHCFIDNFLKNLYLNKKTLNINWLKKLNKKLQIFYDKIIIILVFLSKLSL